jgi:hypothetical protein
MEIKRKCFKKQRENSEDERQEDSTEEKVSVQQPKKVIIK